MDLGINLVEAEFFKGEYEKYAWINIMQPENSGQQRANLEGIEK